MSLARGVTRQNYFNGVKQVFILKKKNGLLFRIIALVYVVWNWRNTLRILANSSFSFGKIT